MQKSIHTLVFLVLIMFLFSLKHFIVLNNQKPYLYVSKQDSALLLKPTYIKLFTFGYSRAISSLIWTATILQSDIEHYKKKDLNSWIYIRLLTISILEPKYYFNYLFGGKYLSIIKDDALGAEKILLKGLEHFPEDFWLNFYIAFNYLFELGNKQDAIKYFNKIAFTKEAQTYAKYLPTLVAKLNFKETNNKEFSINMMRTMYENEDSPEIKEKYKKLYYTLQAEIDLDCLNNSKNIQKCNQRDIEGNFYIKKNNFYIAPKELLKIDPNIKVHQ